MTRVDNLDVDLEADRPTHDAWHLRGFGPLELRAGGKPKSTPATGMLDGCDDNGLIAVCIVVGDDPDISRQADASGDEARP